MKKLVIQFVGALALAAGRLWGVVSSMVADSGVDDPVGAIVDAVRGVPPGMLALYALSFVVVHVARILRWVVQVRPLGETDTRMVFRVCGIGYAAIVAFPFRIGEVVRPWLLARESDRVTFAEAMGTAVTERVVDGLLITSLLFLAVYTAPQEAAPLVRHAGEASLLVFGSASIGIALFAWRQDLARWLVRATIGRLHAGIADAILGLLDGFVSGLKSLASSGALWPFLALTVVYWSANAFGIWLLANAFGLGVPWFAGFGLLSVLVVGIMVPAGIGFLGNFQLFLGKGLELYLPAASVDIVGFAFALTMNLVQLVLQIGFAVPLLAASGIGVSGLIEAQQTAQHLAAEEHEG